MKYKFLLVFAVSATALLTGCQEKHKTLFRLLSSKETGIGFNNLVQETDSFNILTYEYIYNGGGVAVADFNNDGNTDIFFTGNQVKNRLYLNQGDLTFTDITETAGVNVIGRWNSGVTAADINGDGWMDLYVCSTTNPDPEKRRNMLFVNQGKGADGNISFKDMAAEYKVDFNGHSVMAAFFDYDQDSDLDLYVLVNQKLEGVPTNYRPKIKDGTAANNDHLFRNNGDGTFEDVSKEAGIVYEGFGLGLAISDFNQDGWSDIYVSNDYLSNDILYLNNKNGTFSNRTADFMGHQSQFSMGNDAADFNNDGLTDIVTLDMLPEANERKKTTIGNKSYLTYINNDEFKYEYQYVRNMLQLNGGLDQGLKFSEIGQVAGIHQTEWSWSALFADFDNDGNKDLAITNGFPKDITDKDFANYRAEVINIATPALLVDSIPVIEIPNYAFRNNGDLTFTDVSAEWGLNQPSFSNGAAFADLDNDGDLDYVVNNINSPAFVYENGLYSKGGKEDVTRPGFLRIKLKGPQNNSLALGAKVSIYHGGGKMQYQEFSLCRGYLSSVEGILHFGIPPNDQIDSVRIQWPGGLQSRLTGVKTNQQLEIDYNSIEKIPNRSPQRLQKLIENVSQEVKAGFIAPEEDEIDFNIQRSIPHKLSQMGPALAVGDVNSDGLEDFIAGGSRHNSATLFLQMPNGSFQRKEIENARTKEVEDIGLLLFDADQDSDLDLYVVSGGFVPPVDGLELQDRLYKNNGHGNFAIDKGALPEIKSNGSCVRAADFDKDGDLDLFVGGSAIPGQYPMADESYLLRNDGGHFSNVTNDLAPALAHGGVVNDALWTDFDNDGSLDLILACEFIPLKVLKNSNGKFNVVVNPDLDKLSGWWSSIAGGDFDRDGDTDYVVGNMGRNNGYAISEQYPLRIYAKDFDSNKSLDIILTYYIKSLDGTYREYPAHFWDELNQQSPKFRRLFSRYKQFSKASIEHILSAKDLEGATILKTNYPSTSYVENLGKGQFKISPLPMEAQFSPVKGLLAMDFNDDGNLDIGLTGNDFGNEVFVGRLDAQNGLILMGDGRGKFSITPNSQSGFYVPGDARALSWLPGKDQNLVIAAQNRDSLCVFKSSTPKGRNLAVKPMDTYAVFTYGDNRRQKVELYYGSGYLSQSSRQIPLPKQVVKINIVDSKGESRELQPPF